MKNTGKANKKPQKQKTRKPLLKEARDSKKLWVPDYRI